MAFEPTHTGKRQSASDGETMAERPRGDLNSRYVVRGCVGAKRRTSCRKAIETLEWKESSLGEYGVECRRTMSLAKNEPIAVFPRWLLCSETQDVAINNGQYVGHGQARSYMRSSRSVHHPQSLGPDLPGQQSAAIGHAIPCASQWSLGVQSTTRSADASRLRSTVV